MIWNMRFHLKNFLLSIQIGTSQSLKIRAHRFTARNKTEVYSEYREQLLKQRLLHRKKI